MKTSYPQLLPFAVLLVLMIPPLFLNQTSVLLSINGAHNGSLDLIMKHITKLGEGLVIGFAVLLVLFRRSGDFMILLLALAIHLIFIQVNKQVLFEDALRPLAYLRDLGIVDQLHLVKGVEVHSRNTFPSGHTTGAVFGLSFLAILLSNARLSWGFAILALIVGWSRIYLAQHFYTDVYFGYLFGTLSTLFAISIANKYLWTRSWMQKKLIAVQWSTEQFPKFSFKKIQES